MRVVCSVGFAAALILLAGCGDDEVTKPVPTPLPQNTTPAGTIARFVALYENQNATEYTRLFTGDFFFEFSNSADPDLANEYSAGWFKGDEEIAATNLFRGGVNNDGVFQVGAQTIALEFIEASPIGDTLSGRDTTLFKVLLTSIMLRIELPPSSDDPEGFTFSVGVNDPAIHRFSLVRGDMANGLDEDQSADSTRWYIWFWRDESVAQRTLEVGWNHQSSGLAGGTPTVFGITWGELKAFYR